MGAFALSQEAPCHTTHKTHTHTHTHMSASNVNNTSSSETVKGSGAFAPGTTVREIEGHFHKENEPKDAVPVSQDGGLPGVDFAAKVKDAVTGHKGEHEEKKV